MIKKYQYEVVTKDKEDGSLSFKKFWKQKIVKKKLLFLNFSKSIIEDEPNGYHKAIKLAKVLWQSEKYEDVFVQYRMKNDDDKSIKIGFSWKNGRFV